MKTNKRQKHNEKKKMQLKKKLLVKSIEKILMMYIRVVNVLI